MSPGTCCPNDGYSFSAVTTTNTTVTSKSKRPAIYAQRATFKQKLSSADKRGLQDEKEAENETEQKPTEKRKQLSVLINTAVFIYKAVLKALIPGLLATCE